MTDAAAIVARRAATLAALRPVKAEARQRVAEMYQERHELNEQIKDRSAVRELVQNHPNDLFTTPPALAARMVALARISDTDSVCEPSAGTGVIAGEIARVGGVPECYEINYRAAEYLRSKGYPVTCADFLEMGRVVDVFVMNPPFSHLADIRHVRHAYDHLRPGGRVVAILSAGTMYRSDKETQAFRAFMNKPGRRTYFEELPAGTFAASGTNVTSILIRLEYQE